MLWLPQIEHVNVSKHFFIVPDENELVENKSLINITLSDWVNHERFPTFTKVTHGNLHQLWKVRIVLVVSKEKGNSFVFPSSLF